MISWELASFGVEKLCAADLALQRLYDRVDDFIPPPPPGFTTCFPLWLEHADYFASPSCWKLYYPIFTTDQYLCRWASQST